MLTKILPTEGRYCVAVIKEPDAAPFHKWFDSIEEAETYAKKVDLKYHGVYYAQASYDEAGRRKQAHVHRVRSFWFDIDCGEKKPFPDQRTAVQALRKFCADTGLPFPIVVSSGYGLYAHWPLTEDITGQQWMATATLLAAATRHFQFPADSSRTSDSASILRGVGLTNKKRPAPFPVAAQMCDCEPIDYLTFHETLAALPCAAAAMPKGSRTGKSSDIEWGTGDSIPASAVAIAEKCGQIRHLRDTLGNVEEPLWYHSICLLRHTEEAPDIIFRWSSGHPAYSPEETQRKINQSIEADYPPSLCSTFERVNEAGCIGCNFKGKISSPIALGRVSKSIVEDETNEDLIPPPPFRRTEHGLIAPKDDLDVRFYAYDLYVSALAYDESLGYEVMTIRHYLPLEGWLEFTVRTALVNDSKELMKAFWDNHVKVAGQWERKTMVNYVESYAQKLQRRRRLTKLLCQMGWRDTPQGMAFVLGRKIYHEDGSEEDAALAKNVPHAIEAFHGAGDLEPWTEATRILDQPGMEPFAFALCATAFGAPLMKFTGYPGALVSMVGPSGIGKTLIGMWGLSAYGQPERLMMLKDDTKNALIGRLGVYGNLPLYIDEITNIAGPDLSEFVYRITQCRDKARQSRDGIERSSLNHWNTLALVSSNSSLIDKLGGAKSDAGAEINRIFQFEMQSVSPLDRKTATGIYRMFNENYGLAGQVYIKALIADLPNHQRNIDGITAKLDAKTNAQGEERFWSAVAGATLYGGLIAKRLGLLHIDLAKLFEWTVKTIIAMRGHKTELTSDAVDVLARFIDENINRFLIMVPDRSEKGKLSASNLFPPSGGVVGRIEECNNRMWINRTLLRNHMTKEQSPYTIIKTELMSQGVLLQGDKRKVLAANTPFAGAQLPCWEIDTSHPRLGQVVVRVVKENSVPAERKAG